MQGTPRSNQETTLLIFSATVSIAVGLFFVIRLLTGELVLALHNGTIALTAVAVFLWVLLSRKVFVSGVIIASACVLGATIIIYLGGADHFYWAYPSFIAPFFLCNARMASLICGIGLAFLLPIFWVVTDEMVFVRGLVALAANLMFGVTFLVLSGRNKIQLERMVNTDPMTGAGNRRALDDYLQQFTAVKRDDTVELSVLMMDIDHFKPINDSLGHIEGDKVLIQFVQTVQAQLESADRFYRYGGEEFTVITPVATGPALLLAERLRAVIEATHFLQHQQLTVSIGVTSLHGDDTGGSVIKRADMALLVAKGQGRNRVAGA